MKNELLPAIEMRDLADGLWIWRSKIPFDCGNETPLWLPEPRALSFADGLTAPGGELRFGEHHGMKSVYCRFTRVAEASLRICNRVTLGPNRVC